MMPFSCDVRLLLIFTKIEGIVINEFGILKQANYVIILKNFKNGWQKKYQMLEKDDTKQKWIIREMLDSL